VQIDSLKKAEILEEGDQSIYENVMKESYSFYDNASLFEITLRSRGLNYREMYEAEFNIASKTIPFQVKYLLSIVKSILLIGDILLEI